MLHRALTSFAFLILAPGLAAAGRGAGDQGIAAMMRTRAAKDLARAVKDPRLDRKVIKELQSFLRQGRAVAAPLTSVYRGFAFRDYGPVELVRYLRGDWSCIIGSHKFTRELKARLATGAPLNESVQTVATVLTKNAMAHIREHGPESYAVEQSRGTYLGYPVADKRTEGLPTYTLSPFAKQPTQVTSFGYARSAYYSAVNDQVLAPDSAMLVLEVDQRRPTGVGGDGEYILVSHVPPTLIRRFFVGFSNWWNVAQTKGAPPQRRETWFAVAIDRQRSGLPAHFTIRRMGSSHIDEQTGAVHEENGLFEKWTVTNERWSSRSPDSAESIAFLTRYPVLKRLTQEIMSGVPQTKGNSDRNRGQLLGRFGVPNGI